MTKNAPLNIGAKICPTEQADYEPGGFIARYVGWLSKSTTDRSLVQEKYLPKPSQKEMK